MCPHNKMTMIMHCLTMNYMIHCVLTFGIVRTCLRSTEQLVKNVFNSMLEDNHASLMPSLRLGEQLVRIALLLGVGYKKTIIGHWTQSKGNWINDTCDVVGKMLTTSSKHTRRSLILDHLN